MVRKLFKSLLSLSLIAPMSAFALGLGDIHLHSALSERMDADIDLLSVDPSEAQSIHASLASQETFDKVGVERPAVLMFLKFDVVQGESGNYSIKVTSREPISEPFVDFLVEVDWKSGRVLREYTLLLDPPSGQSEAAPAVSAPTTAATTPAATPVATAAATGQAATTAAMPVAKATPSTMGATTMAAPVAGAQVARPAVSIPAEGIVYGPVKANDTLWRIAEQLRPSSDVSVQQMMLALLKANPYAFFDGNINRLKRGFVLRIDDPSVLTAINKADAVHEVARQTRAWQDYRESVAARAKQRPAAASAVEADSAMAVAAVSEPKLKLVAPEGKGVDSATPSGSDEGKSARDMSQELMLALEGSAAQRKENEALKKRLEALEGQLQDMEKIVSLKDADLAALQQQLKGQGKSVEMPLSSEASKAQDTTKPEDKPSETAKPEEKAAEAAKPEVMPSDAAMVDAKPAESVAPVTAKPTEPVAAETKPEAVKPEAKPVQKPKPKPRPVPMPVEEPSLLDQLLGDTLMLGIGGGALILILIMTVILIKRRRKGAFQESILNAAAGSSSMMKASDEQGSETSFLSDLAISGMGPGTIHTDEGEVDPLTEADVFMAYGRNQQAEEVLRKAREKSPGRADIAAKLLEVYYNSKESDKFEALVEEAVGSLQGDDELWDKVSAMGHEICPDNILFKDSTGAVPAMKESKAEHAGDAVLDIGLDLDELSAEMESDGSGAMDLDLGLDFGDLDEDSGAAEAELSSDLGDMEMDLGALAAEEAGGDFDLDLGALEETPAAAESGEMEFDLDLGALEETPAAAESGEMEFDLDLGAAEEVADADTGMDFDLGELSTEGEEAAGFDMDLGDFDLGDIGGDAGNEAASDVGSLDLDMALDDLGSLDDLGGLDDLGELDEGEDVSTKLDLAQAYAEMGDAEGARSMLEEVIAAGNDEQKQQAQALLDKI